MPKPQYKVYYCICKLFSAIDGLHSDIYNEIVKSENNDKIQNLFAINDLMVQIDALDENDMDYEMISETLFKNNPPTFINTIKILDKFIQELQRFHICVHGSSENNYDDRPVHMINYKKKKDNKIQLSKSVNSKNYQLFIILSSNNTQINLAILNNDNKWEVFSSESPYNYMLDSSIPVNDGLITVILNQQFTKFLSRY